MAESSKEKIQQTIRNLEGVLKTSADDSQKKRVLKEIRKWKEELEVLSPYGFDDDDSFEQKITDNEIDPFEEYDILKHITILQMNSNVNNLELNEIYSFVKYFEDEYLGMLSEYYIKLDFNRSFVRDSFYSQIYDILETLNNYAEILEKVKVENLKKSLDNNKYQSNLKLSAQAEYRNLINKIGTYFNKLSDFLTELIEDHDQGGNLISNALQKLNFSSEHGEQQVLEGCTVIDALKDLDLFLTELLDYLNIPIIKKKKLGF